MNPFRFQLWVFSKLPHMSLISRVHVLRSFSLLCLSSRQENALTCWNKVAVGGTMRWISKVAKTVKATKRMEKLGIGPDGKRLPIPNTKKIFPRMYPVLLVNPDGSTYTIRHRYPHRIITLPLDPASLTEEERLLRQQKREAAKARVYVEEEVDDDEWDQSAYRDLIHK